MSTPADNPIGYRISSTLWGAANFTNTAYLLVHGTADGAWCTAVRLLRMALLARGPV